MMGFLQHRQKIAKSIDRYINKLVSTVLFFVVIRHHQTSSMVLLSV